MWNKFNLLKNKKIRIVGYGTVGSAIARSMSAHYQIEVVDNVHTIRYFVANKRAPDAVIICVDAPTVNGTVDPSNLHSALSVVKEELGDVPIMVKTTLTPNLMWMLPNNAVYSPEFLRQKNAYSDFQDQPFMLVGGSEKNCRYWKHIFKYLRTEHIATTPKSASWAKYMHNTFLATKVAFFHDMDKAAEYYAGGKSDFYAALDIIAQHDDQIGATHLYAPNTDGTYGYGGGCFPKDVDAFQTFTNSKLLQKLMEHNDKLNTQRPND
jgi:UDP-glucose 6-dehydrogenase